MSANGRLSPAELSPVEGVLLATGTANAFRRMDAACVAEAGVGIWPALPDGGYRDLATQGNIGAKNPDSTVPIAAAGTSTHGFGNRVDVGSFGAKWGGDGARRAAWLIANSSRFGFYREFGAADPNHFAHDGFTAAGPILAAAGGGTLTPVQEEDDMPTADEIANAVEARLRAAKWVLGPHDEVVPFERALRDLANRQVGYGDRTQDLHVNLVPAALAGIAALAGNRADVDTDALARALLPALLGGLGDRLVTDADLATTRDAILTALAGLPDQTLAALGLQRVRPA